MIQDKRSLRLLAGIASVLTVALGISIIPGAIVAQSTTTLTRISEESAENFVAQPLTNSSVITPLVMLGLAVDEKAYRRAYDDLVDLDGDPNHAIDGTYRNSVVYTGYFGPDLCYAYSATDRRFKANSAAINHYCSGAWSGNFLNWLTMTRMDLIRQALYGGHRVIDSASQTVLERAHVPEDSHAWVKLYGGSDIGQLMPSTPAGGIASFCNVSRETGGSNILSQLSVSAPLLRVAPGAFPLWSAIERLQCDGDNDDPRPGTPGAAGSYIADLAVRVEVCASDTAFREPDCQNYPSGRSKPVGVVQRYGEAGTVRFGLMARSYSRPRSGGQLRRNLGRIARNGNDPSRCAAGDEILLSTGQFCPSSAAEGSLIGSMERLRISGYLFTGRKDGGSPGPEDCDNANLFTRGSGADGIRRPGPLTGEGCNSYGNPVAEILAEALRHVAGASGPSTDSSHPFFSAAADEQAFLRDLEVPDWTDPLADIGACADCNLVMISNGAPTFDGDEIPPLNLKNAGTVTVAEMTAGTNAIGTAEGFNQRVIVGRLESSAPPAATDMAQDAAACSASASNLANLSSVRGICPASPARDGSFNAAGVAYLAHTRDLRPDLAGTQSATTYALEFDDIVPSIPVPTANGILTITPSCQSLATNTAADAILLASGRRQCSFTAALPGPIRAVDGSQYGLALSSTGRSGSVYVAWDEVPYGQSQENKAAQIITWCVGSECPHGPPATRANACFGTTATSAPDCIDGGLRTIGAEELVVRVETLSGFIGAPVLLGYSISGVAEAARNSSYNSLTRPRIDNDTQARNLILRPETPLPASWRAPEVRSFTAGNSGVRALPSPLELAAKYGGFSRDPSATPSLPTATPIDRSSCTATAWDRVNNASGAAAADCIPDNYHGLKHPGQIGARLDRVVRDVIARAGGAQTLRVGVQSGLAQAAGAAYQTFYESQATDSNGRSVAWIGSMQALFVDRDGNLREDDTSRDGVLDESNYSTHPVVQLFFDTASRQTRFRRFSDNPATAPNAFTVIDDLRQLRTFWNARRQLAALNDVETQRGFGTVASSGRHILTFVDLNLDGKVDGNETLAFTPATFSAGRYGVLNVGSSAQATALVNWVRGSDTAGLRSRLIDYDGSGARTQRLGDIINSQPLVVGAPAESYDLLYGDSSYAEFFRQYRNRRQVVYVGANDGMLHAFNAGFRNASGGGFVTALSGSSAVAHPLGSELWAYVPFNLLPHLGFLAAPNYVHAWMMDGSPRAFDVRAFPADATHPGGWGSLLVVGMRLGGGQTTIRGVNEGGSNRSKFSDFATGLGVRSEFVTRPAYVIFDVTDPEVEPRLIAEFTDSTGALGLTTSKPAVAAFVTPATGSTERSDAWYLMFGNGPDDHDPAVSTRSARLYALDLAMLLNPAATLASAVRSLDANGFVGDPVVVDWDLNYRADAVYFGTSVGINPDTATGKLFKIDFNPAPATVGSERADPATWPAPSVVLDTQRPVLNAPSVTQDERGNRWVLSGTGRFLATPDRASTGRQLLFGVIDRPIAEGGTPPTITALTETTDATVSTSGIVSGLGGGISTEQTLIDAIRGIPGGAAGSGGWRYQLATGSTGVNGAERVASSTALLDSILFATGYTPSESLCADQGSSRLIAVNFLTGAPRSVRPALSRIVRIGGVDVLEPLASVSLGQGLAGAPNLFINNPTATGRGRYTINLPTTTGAIVQRLADDSGKIRSGEVDWRETHPN